MVKGYTQFRLEGVSFDATFNDAAEARMAFMRD